MSEVVAQILEFPSNAISSDQLQLNYQNFNRQNGSRSIDPQPVQPPPQATGEDPPKCCQAQRLYMEYFQKETLQNEERIKQGDQDISILSYELNKMQNKFDDQNPKTLKRIKDNEDLGAKRDKLQDQLSILNLEKKTLKEELYEAQILLRRKQDINQKQIEDNRILQEKKDAMEALKEQDIDYCKNILEKNHIKYKQKKETLLQDLQLKQAEHSVTKDKLKDKELTHAKESMLKSKLETDLRDHEQILNAQRDKLDEEKQLHKSYYEKQESDKKQQHKNDKDLLKNSIMNLNKSLMQKKEEHLDTVTSVHDTKLNLHATTRIVREKSREAELWKSRADNFEKSKSIEKEKLVKEYKEKEFLADHHKDKMKQSLIRVQKVEMEKSQKELEVEYLKKKNDELERNKEMEKLKKQMEHQDIIKQRDQEKDYLRSSLSKAEKEKEKLLREAMEHDQNYSKSQKDKDYELFKKQYEHDSEKKNIQNEHLDIQKKVAEQEREKQRLQIESQYHQKRIIDTEEQYQEKINKKAEKVKQIQIEIDSEKEYLKQSLSKAEREKHQKILEAMQHEEEVQKHKRDKEFSIYMKEQEHKKSKDDLRNSHHQEKFEIQKKLKDKDEEIEYHKSPKK